MASRGDGRCRYPLRMRRSGRERRRLQNRSNTLLSIPRWRPVATSKIENSHARRDAEPARDLFAAFTHARRDSREVTFFPERLIWIHRSCRQSSTSLDAAANGRHIHTDDAVLAGRSFFRRSYEAIEPVGDRHVGETCRLEHADHLCFQQSPGNSTRPEIDVGQRLVIELRADEDVPHLDAAARLQDPCDLGNGALLLRNKIQHAIRDHYINAAIFDR